MIQEQSYLEVADNSGARKLMCIRVLGGSRKKFARVGDVIKVSVKEAIPTGRVKKGEVVARSKGLFGFFRSEVKSPMDGILINISDILPITSNQDFFGVSIVEGIYAKTLPILPHRLSYPELIDIKNNKRVFYESEKEFCELFIP